MLSFAARAPWLIAFLAAVLALPILGITAYLTYEVQQLIDRTQSERAGLTQLAALETFFSSASQFALAAGCPQTGSTNLRSLRTRADADFAAVQALQAASSSAPPSWADVRSAWQTLRAPAARAPNADALFDSLENAFMEVGDRSGLTYDADFAGVSLSDALSYRLPEARAQLQSARRRLCSFSNTPALGERLALKKNQVLADKSVADAMQDLGDAIRLEGSRLAMAQLSRAYRDALRTAPRASAALESFMMAAFSNNHATVERTLDDGSASLTALMDAEVPVIDQMLLLRLAHYEQQRTIRLIPGLAGLLAALLVAMLMVRLVLEHAALEVANRTAAEQERMALHDGLTGIMNRRAFFSTLERAVTGGTNLGALCVFDLDHFKQINDTYGHAAGDDLLVRLAHTIEASVRSTDAVARLGGDEFAAFLHPPIDRRGVERVLQKITSDMAVPIEIRGESVRGSVSVGAAMIHGESMSEVQEALARADAALYKAKAAGPGQFVFSDGA